MHDLYIKTGYRSLFKELKYRNAMTTKGDDQLDKLWKRLTNKFSNDLNYIHNIIRTVERSIENDDVRNEIIDQAQYTDMIIEAVIEQIDDNRNVSNKYKEEDVIRNLQNIIPTFWCDLFNKAQKEEKIIYDMRREIADKSNERRAARGGKSGTKGCLVQRSQ